MTSGPPDVYHRRLPDGPAFNKEYNISIMCVSCGHAKAAFLHAVTALNILLFLFYTGSGASGQGKARQWKPGPGLWIQTAV
jgi:hypothetical protein